MPGVLLAEIEVRHSRSVAPTRRVALGELFLPIDPAPGPGPLLLAGIVGTFAWRLHPELRDDLDLLIDDLERWRHIAQPRLRHRFQTDTQGLVSTRHKLIGAGAAMAIEVTDHGHPLPQVLAAVYAASRLAAAARPEAFGLLWRAARWEGADADALLGYLRGPDAARIARHGRQDFGWALAALGFAESEDVERADVVRRFRDAVRDAHPDHGAENVDASRRITELTDARRILLGALAS